MQASVEELVSRFAAGDRRALARLLTLVENGEAPPLPVAKPAIVPAPHPPHPAPRAQVIGITGSGGAGKSTLVGALVRHLRELKISVAVLASDPQSPLTGGALLGDRIRVQFPPGDDGAYFRSLSTRGAQGGISAATGPAIEWLLAFGFDVVLVETVGVGQDQVGVRPLVDRLVLLVTPGTGDEVQWEKAGLIEVADLVVVNKADMPGADRVAAQLTSALSLVPGSTPPPVLQTVSSTGQGIAELWQAIQAVKHGHGA